MAFLTKITRHLSKKNVTMVTTYLYIMTLMVFLTVHLKSFGSVNIDHTSRSLDAETDVTKRAFKISDHDTAASKHDPAVGKQNMDKTDSRSGNKTRDGKETAKVSEIGQQQKVTDKKVPGTVDKDAKSKYSNVEIVHNFEFKMQREPLEMVWQNITEDGTFLIYSAYFDNIHGHPYVRALALNGNTFLPKFFCEITYGNDVIVTVKGTIWMLPDHHEKM